MRKMLPFAIVGILIISGLGAVSATEDKYDNKEVNLRFTKPKIIEHEQYVTIEVDETNSFLIKTGKPILPSYIHTFAFPLGTIIKSVTCEKDNIKQEFLSKDVMPAPEPVIAGLNYIENKHQIIGYSDNNPYPEKLFDYHIGRGMDNGKRCIFLKVQVYPVKFYPEDQTLEWSEDVEITVEYEEPVTTLSSNDEFSFIVLTPNTWSGELSSLVTHKNNRGISTKLVTLNEIYDGSYFEVVGRDNAEKIKYFIKNAYEIWGTTDVLLVGGSDEFPTRNTHIKISNDDQEIFVSDLYYADLFDENGFCSWDSNGNDVFAEYKWGSNQNTDDMDLYPDVRIGRLPAISSQEVNTVVNKIITYETNKAYTQNWFNNLVVIGGDSVPNENEDPEEEDVDEGELVNQAVIDIMQGFIPDKIWDSNKKLSSIIKPYGVDNIDEAINKGCGFVDWSGHGAPTVWTTYPHNIDRQILPTPYPPGLYYNTYNSDLTNGDKLPIVMCGGCSLAKYQANDESFAWTYLTNPNGGGIASFGATGLGYIYIGKYVTYGLVEGFMIGLYRAYDNGATTLGEMWIRAVNNYIPTNPDEGDHKTLTELHTFGDPTLTIAEESLPPNKPEAPNGPTSGSAGTSYTYTASTNDPEGDKISYLFDWGDGKYSEWTDFKNSGEEASASHSWSRSGSFQVRVKAKDEHGVQSDWSETLSVSMPKSKASYISLWEKILDLFPNAFPFLRFILGLYHSLN